jgi:type 1 glutamine amidotransferase
MIALDPHALACGFFVPTCAAESPKPRWYTALMRILGNILSLAVVWSAVITGCAGRQSGTGVNDLIRPVSVVFIAAEDEYHSEKTLALLEAQARSWGWKTTMRTASPDQSTPDNIPGLDALNEADLAVIYMRFRTLPADQVAHLDRYLSRGGAVVGLRTSTHAFAYPPEHPLAEWNGFGERILGAPWIRHFGHDSTTDVSVAPGAERDPMLVGVERTFHVRSWLYDLDGRFPPPEARVLLLGHSCDELGRPVLDRRVSPVAWTMSSPWNGRVFTTTLGHPEDFQNPSFRTLMQHAMRWAAARDGRQKTTDGL